MADSRRSPWPQPGSSEPDEHITTVTEGRQRFLLLAVAGCLLATAVAVGVLVWYINEVRQYRDQQLDIIREEIRVGNCDLLDQFPEGGLLDRPRAKYDCGPGYPTSEIDPQQQREQSELVPRVPPPATPTSELVIPDGPRTMGETT